MPNILDKITNTLNEYVADAKNIKGTYVVVEYEEDLEALPEATIVAGSLAYVTYNSSFYIYNGGWSKIILESVPDDIININSNLDITTTTTLTINPDNLGAWIDGNKVESHVIIAFIDYGIIFSPNGGGSLINPSIGFDLTTIIFYDSKQYLAVLHINPSSDSDNATLSFQELQAGSGVGTGSGDKIYTYKLEWDNPDDSSIKENCIFTANDITFKDSEIYLLNTNISDVIKQTIGSENYTLSKLMDILNSSTLQSAYKLDIIIILLYYFSYNSILIYNDANDGLNTVDITKIGRTNNTSVVFYTTFNTTITRDLSSLNPTLELLGTVGGGGGTGSSRTLYHIEVEDSNNNKAIIPIYKEAFDKYLVEMNEVGQTMATAMSTTWETLETIDDVKDYFDTVKSTQVAYACDLAMNLLVKYAYESGENPVLEFNAYGLVKAYFTVNFLTNYNLSSNLLGMIRSIIYDSEYSNTWDVTYTDGSPVNSNGEETEGSVTINGEINQNNWFKAEPIDTGQLITIDSNATFTYTAEEIASGGSSGEGGTAEIVTGKLYELNMELTRYDTNGDEVPFTNDNLGANYYDDGHTTLKLTLCFYDSNWEKIKAKMNSLIALVNQANNYSLPLLTDVNSLVSFINTNIAEAYAGGNTLSAPFLSAIIPLCDNVYYSDWMTPLENIYNIINVNLVFWSIGMYGSGRLACVEVMFFDSVTTQDTYYALNVHNSCTLTEYATTQTINVGSGSGQGGDGATKTVYDFVVKDNDAGTPTEVYFSIDEDSLNEAIEDINAFYGPLATLQGETYTNLTDVNSVKAMFDYYTVNSLADAVVAALNILVIKSQKAHIYGWDIDLPHNFNINDYTTPSKDYASHTNVYFTGEVKSVCDCGVINVENNQIDAESIFKPWFWSGSLSTGQVSYSGFFTNSSSQTMTFTTRTESTGGSSETVGGGSSDGSTTAELLPERMSIAYNLVVNINQQQYKPNVASWSGTNSNNIRQFQINGAAAGLEDIQGLLSHLTGNSTYDVYNATKPTPCFVFCTQSNICWKLQYDGTDPLLGGLRAYKVENFPFALKSDLPQNNLCYLVVSEATPANRLICMLDRNKVDSSAFVNTMNAGITQINTMFSINIPSYVTIDSLTSIADYLTSLNSSNYMLAKIVFYSNVFQTIVFYGLTLKLRLSDGLATNATVYGLADDANQQYVYLVSYLDTDASPLAMTTLWSSPTDLDFTIEINELD